MKTDKEMDEIWDKEWSKIEAYREKNKALLSEFTKLIIRLELADTYEQIPKMAQGMLSSYLEVTGNKYPWKGKS